MSSVANKLSRRPAVAKPVKVAAAGETRRTSVAAPPAVAMQPATSAPDTDAAPLGPASVAMIAAGCVLVAVFAALALIVHIRRQRMLRQAHSLEADTLRKELCPPSVGAAPRSPSRHRRGHTRTNSLTEDLGISKPSRPMPAAIVVSAARRGVIMTRPDRARWLHQNGAMDSVVEECEEEVMMMESSAIVYPPEPAQLVSLPARCAASLLSRTLSYIHTPSVITYPVIGTPDSAPLLAEPSSAMYTYRFPSARPGSTGSVDSLKTMNYRVELRGSRPKEQLRVVNL